MNFTIARPARFSRGAFTLIEVLATLMLIAIVMPAVMQGISLSTRTASDSRRRTEAAMLAQEKLSEIIATGTWQTGVLSGDFGADWPDYHWQAAVQAWPLDTTTVGLQQIDLTVSWTGRGVQRSVVVSTMTYVREQATG